MLNHKILFNLGYPASYEHETYLIACNYSAKEIESATFKFNEKNHIYLEEICDDSQEIQGKIVEILLKYDLIDKDAVQDVEDPDGEKCLEYYVESPDEFISIFFNLLKIELPGLEWKYDDSYEYCAALDGSGGAFFM